jgi:hypothetical protein
VSAPGHPKGCPWRRAWLLVAWGLVLPCGAAEVPAAALDCRFAPAGRKLVWHVDYFDALGWKDRFVLPESSRRQQGLALAQRGPKIVAPPGASTATQAPIAAARALTLRLPWPASPEPAADHELAIVVWAEDDTGAVVNATWASCAL